MGRETMICPVCGGTIEIEHGTEGVCDTCDARLVDGKIVGESKGSSIIRAGNVFIAPRGQSRSLLRNFENEFPRLLEEATNQLFAKEAKEETDEP